MIVAPWHGEFGWEVALWVPWLRWVKENLYATQDFVVCCAPGHEFLYEDFTSSITPLEIGEIRQRDCQNVWLVDEGLMRKQDYLRKLKEAGFTQRKDLVLTPHDIQFAWPPDSCPRPTKRSTPRLYHPEAQHLHDHVALHVRNSKQHPERNWKHGKAVAVAKALMDEGYKVHCIGTGDAANTIDGTTDFRGETLDEVAALLSNCSVIVGPSSGPLHLANFCDTPAVWWSGNEKDLARYGRHWNPFELPNRTTHEPTWDPNPEQVLDVLAVHFHKQGFDVGTENRETLLE
jgi:hypothetical protein